jgi:hypothetical protein
MQQFVDECGAWHGDSSENAEITGLEQTAFISFCLETQALDAASTTRGIRVKEMARTGRAGTGSESESESELLYD